MYRVCDRFRTVSSAVWYIWFATDRYRPVAPTVPRGHVLLRYVGLTVQRRPCSLALRRRCRHSTRRFTTAVSTTSEPDFNCFITTLTSSTPHGVFSPLSQLQSVRPFYSGLVLRLAVWRSGYIGRHINNVTLHRPGVMPSMSHCQITRSGRFARHVGIIKPNPHPTTNPNCNPKTLTLTLNLTLTVTKEINIK